MCQPAFNIEINELGVWETQATATSEAEAAKKASKLCKITQEDKIRILDPNDKPL